MRIKPCWRRDVFIVNCIWKRFSSDFLGYHRHVRKNATEAIKWQQQTCRCICWYDEALHFRHCQGGCCIHTCTCPCVYYWFMDTVDSAPQTLSWWVLNVYMHLPLRFLSIHFHSRCPPVMPFPHVQPPPKKSLSWLTDQNRFTCSAEEGSVGLESCSWNVIWNFSVDHWSFLGQWILSPTILRHWNILGSSSRLAAYVFQKCSLVHYIFNAPRGSFCLLWRIWCTGGSSHRAISMPQNIGKQYFGPQ